jgi:alkanesulfonate monooxygenase SsuD/methylene tetrahydromethanopterin reductase-like flavin-dependent oxidoreductase (luciferase family)
VFSSGPTSAGAARLAGGDHAEYCLPSTLGAWRDEFRPATCRSLTKERPMQLGVSLEPPSWSSHSGELVLQTAQKAERLGFHSVLMSSHVLANLNGSAMDPLVLLSAVAGATSRIHIATSILVLPYYNPVVLANQAATLDVISRGRFILGVGTGWNPDEFNAVGVPLTERGARADEHLGVMKALWNGRPTDYEGRFTS